jgi:hypothetical protein
VGADGAGVDLMETITSRIEKNTIRIPEAGCWLWTGSIRGKGYGQLTLPGRVQVGAHRAAYEVYVGPVPEGMYVLHKCDVPLCCNPAHLFIGTPKDNMQDCVEKGRLRPGRVGAPRKVSDEQRITIAELRSQGMLQRQIAQQFGITQVRVSQLLRAQSCQ